MLANACRVEARSGAGGLQRSFVMEAIRTGCTCSIEHVKIELKSSLLIQKVYLKYTSGIFKLMI